MGGRAGPISRAAATTTRREIRATSIICKAVSFMATAGATAMIIATGTTGLEATGILTGTTSGGIETILEIGTILGDAGQIMGIRTMDMATATRRPITTTIRAMDIATTTRATDTTTAMATTT